ncbi:MAG: universal stress protein [Burkholderiaceae bacterium]
MTHAYKTLLTHFDSTPRAEIRLRLAARLAADFEAHLCVTYTVLSPMYAEPFMGDGSAYMAQEMLKFQDRRDHEAKARFDAVATSIAVMPEWRKEEGDPVSVMVQHSRYADLMIVGQHIVGQANDTTPEFVARLILGSSCPVLVVPYAGSFDDLGKRPLLAWNASRESARAASAALPLLQRAASVQVVSFDARPGQGGHGDLPGADIATWLARHQVKTTVSTTRAHDVDAGNQILSRAADENSDLIVMGGYGHSRAFEFVMGGATRTVLSAMTVPVLFAH